MQLDLDQEVAVLQVRTIEVIEAAVLLALITEAAAVTELLLLTTEVVEVAAVDLPVLLVEEAADLHLLPDLQDQVVVEETNQTILLNIF